MTEARTIPFVVRGAPKLSAAILAGGLGTRLRSVVADRPKSLAPINGRPCLAYLLDQLDAAGIDHVVLCTGHMGDQIQNAFGDQYRRIRLVYSREPGELGTGGALRHALDLFESDTVLAMNGDSFCDAKLPAFITWHYMQLAEASLLLTHADSTNRYGTVSTCSDGAILSFREKGRNTRPGWINAGVYMIGRNVVESIPEDTNVSLERDIFPAWVDRGLYGYRTRGRFIDIGTPESYATADRFFVEQTA